MTRSQHRNWLYVTAFTIASFGPVFWAGSMLAFNAPSAFTLDLLSWPPLDGYPNAQGSATRFMFAIGSGLLMGLGTMIVCMAWWLYDQQPEAVRKSVVTGLLFWFVFDSTGSILSGHASNAIFNIGILLLAVGPLWRPAQEDRAIAKA